MGNVTAAIVRRQLKGVQRSVTVDLTFSNAYATGGDTLTAAVLDAISPDLKQDTANIETYDPTPKADGTFAVLDKTNKKLLGFTVAGVQLANASDQSAVTVRFEFIFGGATGK